MTFFKTWILPAIFGFAVGGLVLGLSSLLAPLFLASGFGAWLATTAFGVTVGSVMNYLSTTLIGLFAAWLTSTMAMTLITTFISAGIALFVGFQSSKDNHSTTDDEITQLLKNAAQFPALERGHNTLLTENKRVVCEQIMGDILGVALGQKDDKLTV